MSSPTLRARVGRALHLSPSPGLKRVPSGEGEGDVHALEAAVHTAQSPRTSASRHTTYLIATYTGVLEEDDVKEDWFIPCDADRDTDTSPQEEPLVSAKVAQQIDEARREGKGAQFFDPDPRDGAGPWKEKPSATSPQTDAEVKVRLIGTSGSSGELQLAPEMSVYSVFQPDTVDEFAITCPDIGDLQEIEIMQGGNGHDWSSSRWKLEKIVVTCLQSHADGGTGDHADLSAKAASAQWHFVLPVQSKWLGSAPESLEAERALEEKLKEEQQLLERLEEVKREISSQRAAVSLRRQALHAIRQSPVNDPQANTAQIRCYSLEEIAHMRPEQQLNLLK